MIDDVADWIPESIVLDRLRKFEGFKYKKRRGPFYPYQLRGIDLPQAPPRRNDCCTFVEGLVIGAWAAAHADFLWNEERHNQMMVVDEHADRFSPITALVEVNRANGQITG